MHSRERGPWIPPGKYPNPGTREDPQRAAGCFKNTLFFRKYSIQYSVLRSPQASHPPFTGAPQHRQGNIGTFTGEWGRAREQPWCYHCPGGWGKAGLAGSQQQGALLPQSSKKSQSHSAKLSPWGQPLVANDVLYAVSTVEPQLTLPMGSPPCARNWGSPGGW